MPYTETHTITLAPVTLPVGIDVEVSIVPNSSGLQQSVVVSATAPTTKDDTVSLLKEAFALLMTAASAEGVGAPVFQ